MRKLKFLGEFFLAFVLAILLYTFVYQPHQGSTGATVINALDRAARLTVEYFDNNKAASSEQEKKQTLPSDGKLKITMLDVEHGDAILLQDSKQNILVDTGHSKNRQVLFNKLEERGIKKINTVIITHHHADHMGNAVNIAGKYKVGRIYDNGLVNPANENSLKLAEMLRGGRYNNKKLVAGDSISFGEGFYMEVLSPGDFLPKQLREDLNNNSLVMKLHYGEFTMLFTGDIENPTEALLAEKYGSGLKADVLKVAHHGSKSSSNYQFVSRVLPKYALISCGEVEKYNHPNKNVVGRLKHLGAVVYYTSANGDITLTTDGKKIEVSPTR